MEENYIITEEKALAVIKDNYDEAEEILENEDKLEKFLQRLENKLKVIPVAGEKLSEVPVMASLIKSYVKKEYIEIPMGTILAVLGALIYFVSLIDLIPDAIPGVGHIDDVAVITACLKLVESDIVEYSKWREENGTIYY